MSTTTPSIDVTAIPPISHTEGAVLAEGAYDRLVAVFEGLGPDDWSKPTMGALSTTVSSAGFSPFNSVVNRKGPRFGNPAPTPQRKPFDCETVLTQAKKAKAGAKRKRRASVGRCKQCKRTIIGGKKGMTTHLRRSH